MGNEPVLIIYPPSPIEQLPDFYIGFGVGSPMRPGRDVQDKFSQADGIVQSYFHGIVETDGPVDIQRFRNRTPGFFGLAGSDGEAAIKLSDKGWQESIGRFRGGDLRQVQFRRQAVLEGAKEPLDAPLGLRGEGKDGLDAQGA